LVAMSVPPLNDPQLGRRGTTRPLAASSSMVR
jgi:hypothetical protein